MSSLLDVRNGYVTALQGASVLSGVQVYTHGGSFDRKELELFAAQAPALIITLLSVSAQREAGYPVALATWGCVAMAKNEPGIKKTEGGVALMENATWTLLSTMAGTSSTQPVSSAKKQLQWKNLYSSELNALGVALWGCQWDQKIDLVQPDASVDLIRIGMSWDLVPTDGTYEATDLVDNLDAL